MGMDRNYRRIVGKLTSSEIVTFHREILRERGNALSNELVYSSMMKI